MYRTCCRCLDSIFWSGRSLTKSRSGGRIEKREWMRSLSKTLQWTMHFFHHSNVSANAWAVHFSRSRGVTMDRRNEWCYLTPDVISLIRLILWPCVPPLIRNQRDFHSSAHGFQLVYYLKTSFRCSRKSEGKTSICFDPTEFRLQDGNGI